LKNELISLALFEIQDDRGHPAQATKMKKKKILHWVH